MILERNKAVALTSKSLKYPFCSQGSRAVKGTMVGRLKPGCPVQAMLLSYLRGSQRSSIIRRGELLPTQAKSALPYNAGHPRTKQAGKLRMWLLEQFS